MKTLAILPLFAIMACTNPEQPGIQIRTVEVPVVELVHCISPDQLSEALAQKPAPLGTLPADARDASRILAAKLIEYARDYSPLLERLLRGCAAPD